MAHGPAQRVFISSVSGALAFYRRAATDVCHRLGLIPVHMEEFRPERPPPVDVCRREVESCDAIILLLAHRYGSCPRGDERSYTELEYVWATDRRMPLLAFVVDRDFPWPPLDIDRGSDAEALAQFVQRVTTDHVVNRFASIPTFREDLILALQSLFPARPAASDAEDEHAAPLSISAPAFRAVPPYVGSAPFTGRLEDLVRLDAWARSPDPIMVVEAIGGTGKSALTWEWAKHRAQTAIERLAGRMWWSFYDGSASMTRFLREFLVYATKMSRREVRQLVWSDLSGEALLTLEQRPYLIVLDGFERLLTAYHSFDPSKVRDQDARWSKRSLIEPHAADLIRALTR